MRQLDLFGSLIETPAEKEKPEDNSLIAINKEEISANNATEKNSHSSILATDELTEQNTDNGTNETIEQPESITEYVESPEYGPVPSPFEDNIDNNDISLFNEIESSQIKFATDKDDIAESEIADEQKEQKRTDFPETEERTADKKNDILNKDPETAATEKRRTTIQKEPQKRGRKSLEEIEAEADLIEVPEDELLFQKQYYPISEVAKWFRVNTSLLRFWENEFDILKPKKNRKGDRLFRPEDVKNLQLIYQLLRQRKYTIEGAKEYLKTNKKKADTELLLAATLQKFRSFLLDLKANLK